MHKMQWNLRGESPVWVGSMFRDDFITGLMNRLSQEGLTATGRSKEAKKRCVF